MYISVSPDYMKKMEQEAFRQGESGEQLMENAARASLEYIKKEYAEYMPDAKILIVCGAGNNGGDGLALARLFSQEKFNTYVYITGEPKTREAKNNFERLKNTSATILEELPDEKTMQESHFSIIVDAIFGTGFHGKPKDKTAEAIIKINKIGAPIISLDIPSGVEGLTGKTEDIFVKADSTITFGSPKHGLYLNPDGAAGKITTADIGLPKPLAIKDIETTDAVTITETTDLKFLVPKRKPFGYKGDFGRVLLYAGSFGMAGAAVVAAQAAIKSGAGLTYVLCEKGIADILQIAVPNAICVEKAPANTSVMAFGCGINENEKSWLSILNLFDKNIPSIWDAGALNLLAKKPIKLGCNAIITPHIGEAARLLGKTNEEIAGDMFSAAKDLSLKYDCNVMLKGVSTLMYDGKQCAIQPGGVPALAKGGSGDALVGILAAVCAQQKEFKPMPAMQAAAAWLNAAGKYETRRQGEYSPTSLDIVNSLGYALLETHKNIV